MTAATERIKEPALQRAAVGTSLDEVPRINVPARLWRAAVVVGDVLAALAVVLCVPFLILGIGIPIALCVRMLLWIGALL